MDLFEVSQPQPYEPIKYNNPEEEKLHQELIKSCSTDKGSILEAIRRSQAGTMRLILEEYITDLDQRQTIGNALTRQQLAREIENKHPNHPGGCANILNSEILFPGLLVIRYSRESSSAQKATTEEIKDLIDLLVTEEEAIIVSSRQPSAYKHPIRRKPDHTPDAMTILEHAVEKKQGHANKKGFSTNFSGDFPIDRTAVAEAGERMVYSIIGSVLQRQGTVIICSDYIDIFDPFGRGIRIDTINPSITTFIGFADSISYLNKRKAR